MGGDFTGCTSLRKKSCSGGSANSKTSSNGGGGGGGGGGGNNSNSSSSSRNHEGAGKGRRIFDNNNGGGGGIGESGVLVPVHHHYKDPLKTYKIVILGDGGVGKSGNLYIYVYGGFGADIAIPINTIQVLLSSSINSLIAKLMTLLSAVYVQHIGCIRR